MRCPEYTVFLISIATQHNLFYPSQIPLVSTKHSTSFPSCSTYPPILTSIPPPSPSTKSATSTVPSFRRVISLHLNLKTRTTSCPLVSRISRYTHCILTRECAGPDPPSIDMLYEHSDNLNAPPTPTVQPNPPLDIDAMMKELLIDDTTFWSFPTPDDQSSYHASTLNDTVFA